MRDGWEQVALGDVFLPTSDRLGSQTIEPRVFSISKHNGVVPADEYHGRRIASEKLDTYKCLPDKGWAYSTIHIDEGSIARNTNGFDGVVSPMYTTMKWDSETNDPAYFEMLLLSSDMLTRYGDSARGSINRRKSLPWSTFSTMRAEVPPLAEQQRIVDLIGALDEAIEAADQAHQAFQATAVALRADSFKYWLGVFSTVPAGEAFEVMLGRQKSVAQSTGDHVIPYLRAGNIMNGSLSLKDVFTMNFSSKEQAKYCLALGDVLVVEGGSIGQTARWHGEIDGAIGFDKHVLRIRGVAEKSTAGFAFQWARWCYESGTFADAATGATIKALGFSRAKQIPVPMLPIEVQTSGIGHLESADEAVTYAREYLEELRHLRSNLLTALLSGDHEIPESYDVQLPEAV